MKPIIKWAGGKTQLLNEITNKLPKDYKNYYEPFVGGGAVFASDEIQEHLKNNDAKAYLNDLNTQLINLYNQIKNCPDDLILLLNTLSKEHSEDNYYKVRDLYNKYLSSSKMDINSAAYTLYLNKAGFNGLYRLNSKGLYNVPSGKKKVVNLYEDENIKAWTNALKNTVLTTGDFEAACSSCSKGDFVFFDSPYYNTFDTYQAGGFSEEDHKRLKALFDKLTASGVYCMLTNSNENFIKDLYKDYKIKEVQVKRMINSDATKRTGSEVIITNY